jgi:hypothetical protein
MSITTPAALPDAPARTAPPRRTGQPGFGMRCGWSRTRYIRQLISDPELVAPYVSIWDRLRRASAVGDEARAVIERVHADLG